MCISGPLPPAVRGDVTLRCPCSIPCSSTSAGMGVAPKAVTAAVWACLASPRRVDSLRCQPSAAAGRLLTANQTHVVLPSEGTGGGPSHPYLGIPLLLVSMVRIWAVIIRMLMMCSLLYSFAWVLRSPSSQWR